MPFLVARAAQLLDSADPAVSGIARAQIANNIRKALKDDTPDPIPYSEYLSGSKEAGMYGVRFNNQGQSLWTRTRKAAALLRIRIEVSGEQQTLTRLIADDISVSSAKAVRGLRALFRARHTTRFVACPHQGRVAAGLMLDWVSNDSARCCRPGRNSLLWIGPTFTVPGCRCCLCVASHVFHSWTRHATAARSLGA